jgi:hypothetical protein
VREETIAIERESRRELVIVSDHLAAGLCICPARTIEVMKAYLSPTVAGTHCHAQRSRSGHAQRRTGRSP